MEYYVRTRFEDNNGKIWFGFDECETIEDADRSYFNDLMHCQVEAENYNIFAYRIELVRVSDNKMLQADTYGTLL